MTVLTLIFRTLLLAGLYLAARSDLKRHSIPLFLIASLICLGAAYRIAAQEISFWELLISLLPGGILALISLLSQGTLGIGDALVFIAAGAFLGAGDTLCLLLFSFLLSAAFALVMLVFLKRPGKSAIPFIPFVLGGYVCVLMVHGFSGA